MLHALGRSAEALATAEESRIALDALSAPMYSERAHRLVADLSDAAGPSWPVAAGGGAGDAVALALTALGPRFEVRLGDRPMDVHDLGGDPARELLGALLSARAPVHRDRLAAWLWPSGVPGGPPAALADAVVALREALGPDRIVTDAASHRLVLAAADDCDVLRLLRGAAGWGREGAAPKDLEDALVAHASPPFQEWPEAEWARPIRESCTSALIRLRGQLAEALLDAGRFDDAQIQFGQLVDLAPEEESWHRGLMRCHAAAGDTALALRQFHACRSAVRQSLGSDPSIETRALYLQLLQGG